MIVLETESHHVAQTGKKVLDSINPPEYLGLYPHAIACDLESNLLSHPCWSYQTKKETKQNKTITKQKQTNKTKRKEFPKIFKCRRELMVDKNHSSKQVLPD